MRQGSIRASDEDREQVARVLQGHAIAGRLTTEEFEERIGGAFGARTVSELDALLSDLPRGRRHTTTLTRTALTLVLGGVLLLLVGILIVTIAILLALAWAIRLVAAVAVRSLDSRRARALRAGP